MCTQIVPSLAERKIDLPAARPRKRIELPWNVRVGTGKSGHVSSSGFSFAEGMEPCWMEGAREVASIAKSLDRLFGGGRLERLEFQLGGKVCCIVNCSKDSATVRVTPLIHNRARIPVAPASSFSFEGLES